MPPTLNAHLLERAELDLREDAATLWPPQAIGAAPDVPLREAIQTWAGLRGALKKILRLLSQFEVEQISFMLGRAISIEN